MDKKLTPDSEVWYDDTSHKDVFALSWDNDVIYLNKEEAATLRNLLGNWAYEKYTE